MLSLSFHRLLEPLSVYTCSLSSLQLPLHGGVLMPQYNLSLAAVRRRELSHVSSPRSLITIVFFYSQEHVERFALTGVERPFHRGRLRLSENTDIYIIIHNRTKLKL